MEAERPCQRSHVGYSSRNSPEYYAHRLEEDASPAVTPSLGPQRGGKRGAVMTKFSCDFKQDLEFFAGKNISLAQLVYFYKVHENQGRLTAESTCAQVQEEIIIPDTKEQQCAYVDYMIGTPKGPETVVFHWMGLPIRELILAAAQHSSGDILGRSTLEKRTFSGGLAQVEVERTFWICMFSANHHKKKTPGHPISEVSVLEHLLSAMSGALVVFDEELQIASRAWCAFEMHEAAQSGLDLDFGGELARRFDTRDAEVPGLEERQTWHAADAAVIRKHVDFDIGLTAFNEEVEELVTQGAQILAWRRALKAGDFETMKSLVERNADVNWEVTKHDRALTWAVQYGTTRVVRFLLESKAKVNLAMAGGWTALHHAAQLGSKECTRALLEHRANPGPVASGGRTPLIDAVERGYPDIAEMLLDAGADAAVKDGSGLCAAFFAQQSGGDEEFVLRLGWTPELARHWDATGLRSRSATS